MRRKTRAPIQVAPAYGTYSAPLNSSVLSVILSSSERKTTTTMMWTKRTSKIFALRRVGCLWADAVVTWI